MTMTTGLRYFYCAGEKHVDKRQILLAAPIAIVYASSVKEFLSILTTEHKSAYTRNIQDQHKALGTKLL